ncbi:hypothetical protein GF327_02240 [Candidatus Woesearchaeota archaeon]|nr:hypothetical protein [Candidatus Woesearchaeota archaeon]
MKKKSQIQMMQTIIILVIFFFLIAIGLIFYFSYQKSGLKDKSRIYQNIEMIKKSQILSFLPEIQCSFGNIISSDCYDIQKIHAFTSTVYPDNKYYYDSLFGNVRISILKYETKIHNWNQSLIWKGDSGLTLYDNSKPDYSGIRNLEIPVNLFDSALNKYYFGIIKLEIYQ